MNNVLATGILSSHPGRFQGNGKIAAAKIGMTDSILFIFPGEILQKKIVRDSGNRRSSPACSGF
jgi:hypothetical protein